MPTTSRTRCIAAWLTALALILLPEAWGVSRALADTLGSGPGDVTSRPAAVAGQVPTAGVTVTPTTIPNDLQRITAGLPSDGFAGTPCANALNSTCQINAEDPPGGASGTARVASNGMAVTVTVQTGLVPAGSVANVFFPTTFGIENVDCPPAPVSGPVTCSGTAIANVIQGSTVRVFAGNVQVATAQVVGPGAATATPVATVTATASPAAPAVPTAPPTAAPPPTAVPPPAPPAAEPQPPPAEQPAPPPVGEAPPPDAAPPTDASPDAAPPEEAPPSDAAPPDVPPAEEAPPTGDLAPPDLPAPE